MNRMINILYNEKLIERIVMINKDVIRGGLIGAGVGSLISTLVLWKRIAKLEKENHENMVLHNQLVNRTRADLENEDLTPRERGDLLIERLNYITTVYSIQ